MTHDFDLAIVGSGCGASILGMIARRLGFRVILLERGQHPRFAIGESASPLAGILIEQLADRYELPRLRPLASFGEWQRTYPHVVCGLKRGFTFFKHQSGEPYHASPSRENQLLVAASPSDELSDTHWLRSDVDHFLVREAGALGAEYLDRVTLTSVDWEENGCPRLSGDRGGQSVRLRARAVIDASGARGFLHRALGIADRGFKRYPATQALFSHFTDVARCDHMTEFSATEQPPYPIDDAALHHVFDGGWMWVLRFANGVTSAGVAMTDSLAHELRLAEGAPAWSRVLARFPSIAAQFADARAIREFTWMPRLAYRAAEAAGPGWAMLPSAAAFVDPLFSTGLPLTLLGIERLARALEAGDLTGASDYNGVTLAEADHTADFIAGCYAAFSSFKIFGAYSMFYFAAASFSEMARRLECAERPRRFLCLDDRPFGDATRHLSPAGLADIAGMAEYSGRVAQAIDPLNIAGLCEPAKRNWYRIDFEDTVRGAAKLGMSGEDVRARLYATCQDLNEQIVWKPSFS